MFYYELISFAEKQFLQIRMMEQVHVRNHKQLIKLCCSEMYCLVLYCIELYCLSNFVHLNKETNE